MNDNYMGGGLTRGRLLTVYFASQNDPRPLYPGRGGRRAGGSLSADYKAIVLTNIDYLDPKVVAVLEDTRPAAAWC